MSERDYQVEHMLHIGWTPEEIDLKLLDDDLWLLPAYMRSEKLEGEEGVRQWEQVAEFTEELYVWALHSNIPNAAMTQLIMDADVRAREALYRVRKRAQEEALEEG